ncbi:MAG: DinB family protein, partial [Bdellovibrionales bacterium]|nr:DinB family protein [Bdellovibrionales bacterium]
RVRGTPVRIEERVAGLSTSKLIWKRSDDVWSIQENVGHLLTLEPLWATRLSQLIDGLPELLAWEETNSSTWEANYNTQEIENILSRFRSARSEFVSRLETIDSSLIERHALHPRLKTPMRTIDLVYFVAEHDDYHLSQISRIFREHTE